MLGQVCSCLFRLGQVVILVEDRSCWIRLVQVM
jgi:hypothetical protein